MARNIREIPFTEIQERVIKLARVAENTTGKVRGAINDVYQYEIPAKYDWDFLITSSGMVTIEDYMTGSVSVNTGDTTLEFSSAVIDSGMTGRKIKLGDSVYDFTYVNTTTGTIKPQFTGNANAVSFAFHIFQPRYSLPKDFDRFPKNGGLYKWNSGFKDIIAEQAYQDELLNYTSTPGLPKKIRIVEKDTAGCYQFDFQPPPKDARFYGYDYLRSPKQLSETSSGTVNVTAGATAVVGDTNCRFTEATTGDYLRLTALGTKEDSQWFPIMAIQNDSSLTLAVAFANTNMTAATYVISSVPDMPTRLHVALIYGGVRNMLADQDDQNIMLYEKQFVEAMMDAKRIYTSRVYSKDIKTIASEEYTYRR